MEELINHTNHKPLFHKQNSGLRYYCRQPVTLRNVKTSLTIAEIDYFQLCVEQHRTPKHQQKFNCRSCEELTICKTLHALQLGTSNTSTIVGPVRQTQHKGADIFACCVIGHKRPLRKEGPESHSHESQPSHSMATAGCAFRADPSWITSFCSHSWFVS